MAASPDSLINHSKAKAYWSTVDPDINGMLGGFPYVSEADLQTSKSFLAKLGISEAEGVTTPSGNADPGKVAGRVKRAVDCGAG